MQLNDAGIGIIKTFEGCKLKVYKDIVGINTVGYGHVTVLKLGTEITQAEADSLLKVDLNRTAEGVRKALTGLLSDNQFSALVSLAFNVGVGAVAKSTLVKLINQGLFKTAADEFLKWDKAGGQSVPGLTARRKAERELFLS